MVVKQNNQKQEKYYDMRKQFSKERAALASKGVETEKALLAKLLN